jgi:hypothetical protein
MQIDFSIMTQSYFLTMLLDIKTLKFMCIISGVKQRKQYSAIFLILGIVFLAIGVATDQTTFSWIAIASILISLLSGGRWLKRRQ